jgi:hypothetical protein
MSWPEEDIDLALQWQAEQRLQCKSCGHPIDESSNPDSIRAYEAHELTCHACAVIDYRQNALGEQAKDNRDALAGVRVYAVRRPNG